MVAVSFECVVAELHHLVCVGASAGAGAGVPAVGGGVAEEDEPSSLSLRRLLASGTGGGPLLSIFLCPRVFDIVAKAVIVRRRMAN